MQYHIFLPPFPRERKHELRFAGLLTYSSITQPSRFPECAFRKQWLVADGANLLRSSQQRDCPGFSPDSLFIRGFAVWKH